MHDTRFYTVTMPASELTSGVIKLFQFESALYQLPTSFNGTDVSFVGATSELGTFVSIVDSNGAAITATPLAASWQPFQSDLFGMPYVKIVSDVAQDAIRTITICGHAPL